MIQVLHHLLLIPGDEDDFPIEEPGCIEDHCIHWYHQSVWNEFFFGLRCARHNDSGSHEDMLNWSSVDNSIAQIGQWTKRKQKQNKQTAPTTKPKPTKADQSMKVRQVKHVCALTTWCIAQKPRLSQHLQQLVECHTSNN